MLTAQEARKFALDKQKEVDREFLEQVETLIKTRAIQGGFSLEISIRMCTTATKSALQSKLSSEGFNHTWDYRNNALLIEW